MLTEDCSCDGVEEPIGEFMQRAILPGGYVISDTGLEAYV